MHDSRNSFQINRPRWRGRLSDHADPCACVLFGILLLALILSLCASPAYAQVGGAGEVLETQNIRNEMESGQRRRRGAADQDEAPAEAPAAGSEPARSEDSEAAFAAKAQSMEFAFAPVAKVIGLFLVLWMWVAATDWVNKDAQLYRLGHLKWNAILFFPFAALFLLVHFLPLATVVRLPILLVVFLATWIPYVVVHNKNVEPHQTVLTGAWWRYAMAGLLSNLGVKVSSERKAEYEKGAPVELFALGAEDANADNANLLKARNSPGYLLVKDLVVEMVTRRSDQVRLDYTKQGVQVRHEIDGVWHPGEPREREPSDVMLAVMKTLSNLDVKDRRNKQVGKFAAKYEGKSYLCPITSQGVQTGERVVVILQGDKQVIESYDALGMREGIKDKWEEMMASDQGLLILSTLPGGGLTTITNASLEETDRLMRDFAAIEEVNHREHEIQNINVTTFDASKGETPATVLPKLIRTYPNVYVCRDFVDAESAKLLIHEIRDERLVITTVYAREAAEALLRILQTKIPAKDFARVVKAVLYQRLIRKLCPDCKVGYTPPAEVLKKLGIPPGKVEKLYRPPKAEEIEKPCPTCQGIGYYGRTGVFELLVINDQMREILLKQPKLELIKKAAQNSRQRSLQEEAILLVAKGVTSLPELQRALKG